MKLARFKHFIDALSGDPLLREGGHSPKIFRFFNAQWFDESGHLINNARQLSDLQDAWTSSTGYWRARSQHNCYIKLAPLSAIIRLEFDVSPTKATQRQFKSHLESCFSNSTNAFDATHDGLTELPNRKAFEQKMDGAIAAVPLTPPSADDALPTTALDGAQIGFALLAFDLDHFKQVNDSYTHQYGDIVLIAFAWRLQEAVDRHSASFAVSCTVSRFGGEEFYVLVRNIYDTTQVIDFAEKIRQEIREDPIPSSLQWEILSNEKSLPQEMLPHQSERKVTASIGCVTYMNTPTPPTDVKAIRAQLLKQADTALYRSKADGRDCVRAFEHIRERFGRIIEYHTDADIVAIDIGENVGVKVGQEYLVFHPQFVGDVPFYFHDGRTKRRLGNYPRRHCGRIAVTSVSREISFCTVTDRQLSVPFPVGARLEYIRLGFISHHIGGAPWGEAQPLTQVSEIETRAFEFAISSTEFVVSSITVRELSAIADRQGVSHANQILASIYRILQENFPPETVLSPNYFGADFEFIVFLPAKMEHDALIPMLKNIVSRTARLAKIRIGAFAPNNSFSFEANSNPIEMARLAALAGDDVCIFDTNTPNNIIQTLRKTDKALAIDTYSKMQSLKIPENALYLNAVGLCHMERSPPDYEEAAKLCFEACTLDPTSTVYSKNYGYSLFRLQRYESAYKAFKQSHSEIIPGNTQSYLGYKLGYAYSAYRSASLFPEDRPDIIQAIASALTSLPPKQNWLNDDEIRAMREFFDSLS